MYFLVITRPLASKGRRRSSSPSPLLLHLHPPLIPSQPLNWCPIACHRLVLITFLFFLSLRSQTSYSCLPTYLISFRFFFIPRLSCLSFIIQQESSFSWRLPIINIWLYYLPDGKKENGTETLHPSKKGGNIWLVSSPVKNEGQQRGVEKTSSPSSFASSSWHMWKSGTRCGPAIKSLESFFVYWGSMEALRSGTGHLSKPKTSIRPTSGLT